MRRTVFCVCVIAFVLGVLDQLVGVLCRASRLADRVTDVQQPATLLAKLDRLRSAPSPKIVLVGDSLVRGGNLEEAGDPNWRAHDLASQLAAELSARPGSHPLVMNLGIDGLLPADLEYLIPLVVACGVDWVLFDIHLRPFSSDFSPPERRMARPWLRDLSADRPFCDASAILRNRTLVQENLLWTTMARRPALRSTALSATDAEVQSLVKLAQLKNRVRHLDLGPGDPQITAMDHVLRWLAANGQHYVVFYAKENPALLPEMMEPDEYAVRYARVVQLVQDAGGPAGVFVPPLSDLGPEHFTDFTHLTADGYRRLARRLADEIK